MELTVLITIEELKATITSCVNECLKNFQLNQLKKEVEEEQLLTAVEAGKLLKIQMPTLYALTSKNMLPFMKKGKRLYFSKKDLINYVRSGRNRTVDEIKQGAEEHLGELGRRRFGL